MNRTLKRIRILGAILAAAGLVVAGFGLLYGFPMASQGLDSAQAMYQAQGVTLSYNEDGQLIDRGTTAEAQKTLDLLEGDWNYPVDQSNFDPNDPLVNTRDELMYEYATITKHVLHGTVDVELSQDDVPITYRGVTYDEPGTYEIEVGQYYAELDRNHPIEGQLRGAWTPQALALLSALAGGHANQAAGEVAWFMSLAMGGVGLLFAGAGAGLVWVSFGPQAKPHAQPSQTHVARRSGSELPRSPGVMAPAESRATHGVSARRH